MSGLRQRGIFHCRPWNAKRKSIAHMIRWKLENQQYGYSDSKISDRPIVVVLQQLKVGQVKIDYVKMCKDLVRIAGWAERSKLCCCRQSSTRMCLRLGWMPNWKWHEKIIASRLLKVVQGVEEKKFTSSTLTISDFIWQFPPVVWQSKAIGGGFAKSERPFQFRISRDIKRKYKNGLQQMEQCTVWESRVLTNKGEELLSDFFKKYCNKVTHVKSREPWWFPTEILTSKTRTADWAIPSTHHL